MRKEIKLIIEGCEMSIMNVKTGEVFASAFLSEKVPEPVYMETLKHFQSLLEDCRIMEE